MVAASPQPVALASPEEREERGDRYYPLLLDLRDRECVVVGGGEVAAGKAEGLLACGALVRVVAPRLCERLVRWRAEGRVVHVARRFRPGDLDGAFLVLCERTVEEKARVFAEADERGLFVNVEDDLRYCSFIAPAILRQGDLTVAISTGGAAPALAVRLRDRLRRELGPHYGRFLALARRFRAPLLEAVPDFAERRRRWYRLVDSETLGLFAVGRDRVAMRRMVEILGVEPEA